MKNLEHLKSPKRQTSSLLLGGRFGRSCFLMAGGCLGKRSKQWDLPQFNAEENDVSLDFNSVNEIHPTSIRSQTGRASEENDNQKISHFQRLFPFNPTNDRFQGIPEQDYLALYLQ